MEHERKEGEQEDMSSRTVLVLVALTLVVSFISAWVSISTAENIGTFTPPPPKAADSPTSQAHVALTITQPGNDQATGKVTFEVLPADG